MMDEKIASLLVRLQIELAGEGLGPHDPQPYDDELMEQALTIVGDSIDPVFLWWAQRTDQAQHIDQHAPPTDTTP